MEEEYGEEGRGVCMYVDGFRDSDGLLTTTESGGTVHAWSREGGAKW